MADKNFIGKVSAKQWPDGNESITIRFSDEDKKTIKNSDDDFLIEVKKSKAGKWYAEWKNIAKKDVPF